MGHAAKRNEVLKCCTQFYNRTQGDIITPQNISYSLMEAIQHIVRRTCSTQNLSVEVEVDLQAVCLDVEVV